MQFQKSSLTLFHRLNHYSFHTQPHFPCLAHQVRTRMWTYKKCKILTLTEITVGVTYLNFSSSNPQNSDMKITQLCTQILIQIFLVIQRPSGLNVCR